jgi:hypothetical protein
MKLMQLSSKQQVVTGKQVYPSRHFAVLQPSHFSVFQLIKVYYVQFVQ